MTEGSGFPSIKALFDIDLDKEWRFALDQFRRPLPNTAILAELLRLNPVPDWARYELAELLDPLLGTMAVRLVPEPAKHKGPRLWYLDRLREVEVAVAIGARPKGKSVDDAVEDAAAHFRMGRKQVYASWNTFKTLIKAHGVSPDLKAKLLAYVLEERIKRVQIELVLPSQIRSKKPRNGKRP